MDQIAREHHRILEAYSRALENAKALIQVEQQAIKDALANGVRFAPRHKLQDLAYTILETTNKLSVFDNLTWKA